MLYMDQNKYIETKKLSQKLNERVKLAYYMVSRVLKT